MASGPTPMQPSASFRFPRPSKPLIALMAGLFAIWLVFAVGSSLGAGTGRAFTALMGSTHEVLSGQLWRLFTAPLLHQPAGDGALAHILSTLLGIYFLGPSMERRWGAKRLVLFLYAAALVGFVTQMLAEVALPVRLSSHLVQPWFGSLSAVQALAIAWALSFRGQQAQLMMVLPISSNVLILIVVGFSVLHLFTGGAVPEGLISPFGAMLFGWLAGAGKPSPLRRLWLNWRLKRLQKHAGTITTPQRLRVIEGGKAKPSTPASDKRWLN